MATKLSDLKQLFRYGNYGSVMEDDQGYRYYISLRQKGIHRLHKTGEYGISSSIVKEMLVKWKVDVVVLVLEDESRVIFTEADNYANFGTTRQFEGYDEQIFVPESLFVTQHTPWKSPW